MSGRRCPACAHGLSAGRLGPVNLELCLTCGGAWANLATLKQVVQAPVAALERLAQTLRAQANPSVQRLLTQACPSCDRVLVPVEFPSLPGAKITTCGVCESYWLDVAALDRIVQSLQAVATRVVSPPSSSAAGAPPPPTGASSAPAGPASPHSGSPPHGAQPPPAPEYAPQTPSGNYYGTPPPPPVGGASYYGAPPPKEVTLPNSRLDTPATTRPSATNPGLPRAGNARPGERLCEQCGQPNGEKVPVCWACGHMFLGQIVGKCPRCNGALHRIDSDGIFVDACDGCGGVWLERGRLSAMVFQSREQQQWIKSKVREIATGRIRKLNDQILCPDCGLIMFPKTIGTITQHPICTCPQCTANFLDADAVEEVIGR